MKSDLNNSKGFKHHLEKFIAIKDDEFEVILTYFTVEKCKKNDVLIDLGDKVQQTFWVHKGLLTSTFVDQQGKDHIIQFANENCWITDQNAFYNQTHATFTIRCIEDSELLCLSFENREKLCLANHKMERFFRKKANESFTKLQQRLVTYLTSDAKKRFDLLLLEYPGLIQRLSKKTLAAYLGVSRETLSRFGK